MGHNSDTAKTQRIRDPIHDLIVFDGKEGLEQLVWRLLDCREFQRLRRIRQLGFSEFVFPGATHSRFSHCLGVFHTARELLRVIEKLKGRLDNDRARVSLCAALLHDLGHGPFSHVFEGVTKQLGRRKDHEEWTAEIVTGDTEVAKVLRNADSSLPSAIADLVAAEDPIDIYAALVSSQFDADRLDYLRRDRYMCGVAVGGFDYSWLLENLVIGEVVPATEAEKAVGRKISWLVLHPKAREAAEGYLLARYQLYSTIYYHKTTRSAEKMLGVLLARTAMLLREVRPDKLGLPIDHPVIAFLQTDSCDIETYLRLDDSAVWSLIVALSNCADATLQDLGRRLSARKLFKPFDISARTEPESSSGEEFLFELKSNAKAWGLAWGETIIEDRPRQKGYDWYEWDSQSSLKKVLIAGMEQKGNIDIGSSPIVKALSSKQFLRVYVPDEDNRQKIEKLWKKWRR